MNEKEMKKLDEKGEEKVSGGSNIDKDRIKNILLAQAYGAPALSPILGHKLKQTEFKKFERKKKPEEALTASQPQAEEEKK